MRTLIYDALAAFGCASFTLVLVVLVGVLLAFRLGLIPKFWKEKPDGPDKPAP